MGSSLFKWLAVTGIIAFSHPTVCQSAEPGGAETNAATEISTNAVATNAVGEPATDQTTSSQVTAVAVDPALASFTVKKGFRIELVAPGFEVCAPASMAFDEDGRLFVAEMRDYPDRRDSNPHLGRIRLLQSTKGDGVFDSSTVYADNLPLPSSIICYGGGIFVAATPEILFLKDTNGDGTADERKRVLNGFGGGGNNLEPDSLVNGLTWGLDNRIHGVGSCIGGLISADSATDSVDLGVHDFSFDPRTAILMPEAGPGQFGLSFDLRGRKYVSNLIHPLRLALSEPRYFLRNPYYVAPSEMVDVVNASTPIFAQTLKANGTNAANGIAPRGGLSPRWFTNARACVIYDGSAFPSTYLGHAFIADSAAHIIHHVVLRESGLGVKAARAQDEQTTEFLTSNDPLFHPTHLLNGPEGALYIADFRDGGDNGRIYRIVPANFRASKFASLGRAPTYELVVNLAHPNGWQRDTAARLLYEKRDPAAVPLLSNVLQNARAPLGRLHALQALSGVGALNQAQLLRGLGDSDDRIREQAVRLTENFGRNNAISDQLWEGLRGRVTDPSLLVRYQLALSVGQISHPDRLLALAQILAADINHPWIQAAVLSSVSAGAGRLFVGLAADARMRNDPAGLSFLQRLAGLIGLKGQLDEVSQVLDSIQRDTFNFQQSYGILFRLGEGLGLNSSALALVDPQKHLQRFEAQALLTAADDSSPIALRVDAIRFLGFSHYTFHDMADLLLILLSPAEPQPIQSAVLACLGRMADARVTTNVLARWPALTPAMRTEAISTLLVRDDHLPAMMTALQNGTLPPRDFSPSAANFLRTYPEDRVRQVALRIFGPVQLARPAVVDAFKPAIRSNGEPGRGRQIFQARCATCHVYNGEGRQVGPELTSARAMGRERLLSKILQPNLDLKRSQAATVVKTIAGDNFVGLLADQNPTTLTLRLQDGTSVVLPGRNLLPLQIQPWSIMPEGLEQGLTVPDMASLLDYLAPKP